MERTRETPALEDLKDLARTTRLPNYMRDAFIEHIRNKHVRGMARLFSESISGPDGDVHLANSDYRLVLATIRNALGAQDEIDMAVRWKNGLETLGATMMPSSANIMDRMVKLMDGTETSATLDRKLRDLHRLVEMSYPLGTIVTDPAGGDNAFIPASSGVRVGPAGSNGVLHSLEFTPEDGDTVQHHVSQYDGNSYVNQNVIGDGGMMAFGKPRGMISFFRQRFSSRFNIDPSSDVGDGHRLPGWLIVARSRGRLAFMLKHVGTKSESELSASMTVSSGETTTVTQASAETKEGHVLTVRQWPRPGKNGVDFFGEPSVRYDFYTGERTANMPFGKTVRTSAESAQ
jgi:hypothetical protein